MGGTVRKEEVLMDKIDFLLDLDDMIRQQTTYGNQAFWAAAIYDMLQYISGKTMDFGMRSFTPQVSEDWTAIEGKEYYWCGVDEGPYGFSVDALSTFVMDRQEIVDSLWKTLYMTDKDGNVVMEERDGVEYAAKLYDAFDVAALRNKYQEMEELLSDCDIAKCVYELHEDIFSYAHNMEENMILLELVIYSSEDVDNECGSQDKLILTLKSPALDAWETFMASENNVADEDRKRFQAIFSGLNKEEVTYETSDDAFELSSFSTGSGSSDGWYRTIIHDFYCYYNSNGVNTCFLFFYGLVSLRYLSIMMEMQDFLRQMDEKYGYFLCGDKYLIDKTEAEG